MSTGQDYELSEGGSAEKASELVWRPAAVSNMLGELPRRRIDGGAWHQDFLTLGHRLRVTYGNTLDLDEDAPAYLVECGVVTVTIACSVESERAELVWLRALALENVAPSPDFARSLLQMSARLALVRLSLIERSVWVEYELPFCAAHAPALAAGVSAVGRGVRQVRERVGTS